MPADGSCSEDMLENIRILEKETREPHRKILEAINIKLKGATLNCNEGTELPDVYLPLLREEASAEGDRH